MIEDIAGGLPPVLSVFLFDQPTGTHAHLRFSQIKDSLAITIKMNEESRERGESLKSKVWNGNIINDYDELVEGMRERKRRSKE